MVERVLPKKYYSQGRIIITPVFETRIKRLYEVVPVTDKSNKLPREFFLTYNDKESFERAIIKAEISYGSNRNFWIFGKPKTHRYHTSFIAKGFTP